MRGVILAFQFLTRLPMPQLANFREEELSSSAVWFPLVGLSIGLLLVMAALLGMNANNWIAALLAVLVWVTITGALHLDGAADLADALGASHRNPERFLAVLKDPHIGTFGVVILVSILLTKLVATASVVEITGTGGLWTLLLIPAWARLGSVFWSQMLEALAPGRGEQFSWHIPKTGIWIWGICLFVLSLLAVSLLFAAMAVVVLFLWWAFLKWKVGGMTGDCLGAGIEYCECAMLLAVGLM